MNKIALIKDGIIENIAMWAGDQGWYDAMKALGYDLVDVTDIFCGPRFTYNNGVFTAPENQ